MASTVHIAVDCMSGDYGPRSNLEGIINVIRSYPDIHFHLCGSELDILSVLPLSLYNRVTVYPTTHVISPELKPSAALRIKEVTSLHKALDLVADNSASIVVSSANTGAYMALSLKKFGLASNLKRPAIGKLVPSLYEAAPCKQTLLLDLGANVNCSSETLVSFALLAKEYLFKTQHLLNPKMAILNIGSEAGKGTEDLIKTFDILTNIPDIEFLGFVEGDSLLKGVADIIVCDGFHGNIALKTMEGTIKAFYNVLKTTMLRSNISSKIGAFFLGSHLKKAFSETYDPRKYNGALLMGLTRNVVKSHGGADKEAFAYALISAYEIAKSTNH